MLQQNSTHMDTLTEGDFDRHMLRILDFFGGSQGLTEDDWEYLTTMIPPTLLDRLVLSPHSHESTSESTSKQA